MTILNSEFSWMHHLINFELLFFFELLTFIDITNMSIPHLAEANIWNEACQRMVENGAWVFNVSGWGVQVTQEKSTREINKRKQPAFS